jgi:hypothetical protein
VRLAVRAAASAEANVASYAILELVVRHGQPTVRPDDILAGLLHVSGLVAPEPPRQTRIAQGPFDPQTGVVGDPLRPDRDATATAGRDR